MASAFKNLINIKENKIDSLHMYINESISPKIDDNQIELKKKIWFNMKESVSSFTGRLEDLNKIDTILSSNSPTTLVICGLGGVGKSELARRYAWKLQHTHDMHVIWMESESADLLKELFRKLACELCVPTVFEQIERLMDAIIRDIYKKLSKQKCLIIFDNALNRHTLQPFLPQNHEKNISVIITSQVQKWDNFQSLCLDVLLVNDANDFLRYILKDCSKLSLQKNHVNRLCEILGYLPLALQQAAAYIKYKIIDLSESYTIEQYLQEIDNLLDYDYMKNIPFYDDCEVIHHKTIFKTLELTRNSIKNSVQNADTCFEILYICCFLAPDNISRIMLTRLDMDETLIKKALHILVTYSLLTETYKEDSKYYNIHRVVQMVFRNITKSCDIHESMLKKTLKLVMCDALKNTAHCTTVLQCITKHYATRYNYFFDEYLKNDTLLYACAYNNLSELVTYLLPKICSTVLHGGMQAAIETNNFQIVKKIFEFNLEFFNPYINDFLYQSALHSHINLVQYFVRKGADIDYQDVRGYGAIHASCINNNEQIVTYFLEKGCNVNILTYQGFSALHGAAYVGNIIIVEKLIKKGGNINALLFDGISPLHSAALAGNLSVVDYLIQCKCNINCVNNCNQTPLYYAALRGYDNIVDCLVKHDADIHIEDNQGRSPIHIAAQHGHLNVLSCLINIYGDSINKLNSHGYSILHYTVLGGNIDALSYLLENNVPLNIHNDKGHSLMHFAAIEGNTDIIKILHSKGADINITDDKGICPLHIAAECGHKSVVLYFLSLGMNVDFTNIDGYTPLHIASEHGHLDVIECLVENGANINYLTVNKISPLHVAVESGHIAIVEFLIMNESNVNEANIDGFIPIHLAAMNGHSDIMDYLILTGTDVSCKNVGGYTPLHLAAHYNHCTIIEGLIKEHVDINISTQDGDSPLHIAAKEGHIAIAKCLLANGADINIVNNDGFSSLHLATLNGHTEMFKYLVEQGADTDILSNSDISVLHIATHYGHLDIITYLKQIFIIKLLKNVTHTETVTVLDITENQPRLYSLGIDNEQVILNSNEETQDDLSKINIQEASIQLISDNKKSPTTNNTCISCCSIL